jgi:hypothetical protein
MHFLCALCLFTFPHPSTTDIDDVRRLIERTYSAQNQPWSEVGGPYAKVRLILLTPNFGLADATLTSFAPTSTATRSIRLPVKKENGDWTIYRPQ